MSTFENTTDIPSFQFKLKALTETTPTTLANAKQHNLSKYTPIKPCKHGHSLRYVRNNRCVKCSYIAVKQNRKRLASNSTDDAYGKMDKKTATKLGLVSYTPFNACVRGHYRRYAKTGACAECNTIRAKKVRKATKKAQPTKPAVYPQSFMYKDDATGSVKKFENTNNQAFRELLQPDTNINYTDDDIAQIVNLLEYIKSTKH